MQILAPAGNADSLAAAVRSGADAVYLGAGAFNARRNAENFGPGGLKAAIEYCHGRGVEVHVTLNTLIRDEEREDFLQTAREVIEAGADAVIVQDMGAAAYLRRLCPELPLSASTQMAIHNAAGAKKMEEMGFFQAVLARELSLKEIKYIHDNTNIRLETFVHGAHCMSVSGMCYMSAALGERSGNRGLCAQPCRLNFVCRGREYALSLKDLSFVAHIKELEQAGVTTLKIEGRMKRPEYVAAAVTAVRQARAGEQPDMEGLKKIFSRSGFTDGYLMGRRNLSMFGVRTEADARESRDVLGQMAGLYRREFPGVGVDMTLKTHGEAVTLTVGDGENIVTLEKRPEQTARSPLTKETARRNLSKTGGMPFYLREAQIDLPEGVLLAGSQISDMRREALEQLLTLRSRGRAYTLQDCEVTAVSPCLPGKRELRLRFEQEEQAFFPEGVRVQLPVEVLEKCPELLEKDVIGELPALVWPLEEERLKNRLLVLKEQGLKAVAAGNVGTAALALALGLEVHGDAPLNITNTDSLLFYEGMGLKSLTLSMELPLQHGAKLGGSIKRGILAYGHLPLMYFRCCPAQGPGGCGGCQGRPVITDRLRKSFPLVCHGRRYTTLHNGVPLYLGDRERPAFDFETLYFTTETPEQCRQIYALYRQGKPFDGERTTGLAFRLLK